MGKKFSAVEGHEAGFIAEVPSPSHVLQTALKLAESYGHHLDLLTLGHLKEQWYKDLHKKLLKPSFFYSSL